MKTVTYLRRLAEQRYPNADLKIHEHGNGHIQIQGPLLINYYPESKKRTAYVDGTKEGQHGVSPEKALAMAFSQPPMAGNRDARSNQGRAKRRLLRKAPCVDGKYPCMWCRGFFEKQQLTVEHVIPLARGGLDNDNNKGLACAGCNHGRGHNMPELNAQREAAKPHG